MIAADPTIRRPAVDPAGRSFIEVQFPVAKLSKESYKERKAGNTQTLTGLGKWWGRKPLILVRAVILGLLLPATDGPDSDRDIFLALMTMDEPGLLRRWQKPIPARIVWDLSSPRDRVLLFENTGERVSWKRGITAEERKRAQKRTFLAMSYDAKLAYCVRPEEIEGPSSEAWAKINAHLGTEAESLPDLVRVLGERRWGHAPRVGDAFCGGGSIPFEAAHIGCDVTAYDLNPVACLLTWGALNIVGGGEPAVTRVREAQERVFAAMRAQVDEWGIERDERGWVADAYIYCNEVRDPNSGWRVPLAPSWVIGQGTRTIARLVPDQIGKRFDIEVLQGVSLAELDQASREGTAFVGVRCPVDTNGNWLTPDSRVVTSTEQLRGAKGLRHWENDDLFPRLSDVYQERLYCVRWVNPATGERRYRSVTADDLEREQLVLDLIGERFDRWQMEGFIPSRRIESGRETDRLYRERGWTHWHHLFHPRQLLVGGLFAELSETLDLDQLQRVGQLLMSARLANWSSRLTMWISDAAKEQGRETFYNQALNPSNNYSVRATVALDTTVLSPIKVAAVHGASVVAPGDARTIGRTQDLWITDPGYADAVNYEEVSEFFLAWEERRICDLFPDWYADSMRALAIKGAGEAFRVGLSECYVNLSNHMADDGMQVVMFTHQDPAVWADVGLTLWAAGLQVQAAWTVATESTATGLKSGNYVQGTVNLVLRKRIGGKRGDLSDLFPEIQDEVRRQIEEMQNLDDLTDPNFGDADLQLAAYAASLRVLTGYAEIDEIDIERELWRTRARGEESPLTRLIRQAVRIASDYLVPKGVEPATWRRLTPEERLYLKGIETEAGGEAREGVFQELSRGYGAGPHRELYASRAANRVRFKTPTEFGSRDLRRVGDEGFAGSTLRQMLHAVASVAAHAERDPRPARVSLRAALPNYWTERERLADMLIWLSDRASVLPHWQADADAARLLAASLRNDSV